MPCFIYMKFMSHGTLGFGCKTMSDREPETKCDMGHHHASSVIRQFPQTKLHLNTIATISSHACGPKSWRGRSDTRDAYHHNKHLKE